MSCENPKDCRGCSGCLPVDPVEPRCDFALDDGVYVHATVTVENGCIVDVTEGDIPVYEVDPCCEPPGGGVDVSDEPCDCPPGEDGENATVEIGDTHSVSPDSSPKVVNIGSESHAILEFHIPRGEDGEDGEGPSGVTEDAGGIEIEDGVIKDLPPMWPPALSFDANVDPADSGVTFSVSGPDDDGKVKMDLDMGSVIEGLQQEMASLQSNVNNQLQAFQDMIGQIENTMLDHVDSTNDRFEELIDCVNDRFSTVCDDLNSVNGALSSSNQVDLNCGEDDECEDNPFNPNALP